SVWMRSVRTLGRLAREEALDLLLLLDVPLRARIQRLHLGALGVAQARKVTDEVDQLPGGLRVVGPLLAPRRHAGEAHAVLDDVEELAVGERLRLRGAQVGRPRREVASDRGVAAAVVSV